MTKQAGESHITEPSAYMQEEVVRLSSEEKSEDKGKREQQFRENFKNVQQKRDSTTHAFGRSALSVEKWFEDKIFEDEQQHPRRFHNVTWRLQGEDHIQIFDVVIIGGGLAGGHAMKELIHQRVKKHGCLVITMEQAMPYDRSQLSKAYMKDKTLSPRLGGMHCCNFEQIVKRG